MVTGTDLGGGHVGLDISGTITATNPSVGTNGAAAPASSTEVGMIDGSGNLQGVSATNPLPVTGTVTANSPSVGATGSAVPADATMVGGSDGTNLKALKVSTAGVLSVDGSAVTQPVSAASLPLPTGAATAANQTNASAKSQVVNSSGTSVDAKTLATQVVSTDVGMVVNAVIHGLNSGGGGTYVDVKVNPSGALVTDGSGSIQPVSGTFWQATQPVSGTFWQATQPVSAASLPLPTGASTSANQTTGNTSLATIATNSAKQPINTTGSGSGAAATVSTVITLSAPANAVGFILQCLDTSTANVRWCIGRTASATLGQQLQPGRDSGYVPCGANVSLCAESGTQNYDVQWVSQ